MASLHPYHHADENWQMLFNVEELRTYCINHLCDQEFCVTCELGFLYRTQQSGVIAQRSRDQAMSYAVIDMLSISAGRNCHSSNVVRAIKMLPEGTWLKFARRQLY